MPKPRRKTLLISLTALLWLAAMIAAYFWFEARYIRTFSDQTALFSGSELRLPEHLAGPGPIRLVHFWDPGCPCNVGNQQHLGELIERFAPQGVAFYTVQKAGSKGRLPANLDALQALATLPGSEQLPASPAVAIWDQQGQLAYFGPYSEGLTCSSSNSFIEPILEALAAGRHVDASNTLAVGCFCAWTPTPE
ncbi:MAG: thiol-disulfide isomerase [Gammaproteobacteria bacterium]|nr:thiol-disulfide isomerase [Gammaproteobacteria bacterium]MBU1491814.1 thiol-disulfide isomerase [Gammaproteobacteria bacterium]MBU2064544.1 thiol-disulfide isomerase [Gammaproteobacteria bacterium]MBU2140027.1 thiol-disulfide isomerase [Gammaproteobacteria bacterium]MBU2216782.1 thiol-disulfide isomerase [Gammaproteobacteria bacterium]